MNIDVLWPRLYASRAIQSGVKRKDGGPDFLLLNFPFLYVA